ncbi:hypothetical protein ACFVU3_14040 [Streptomyces sp. NPDC058052]|uniref:hypothetical protein n=1 Tax=Streptomyces sp. NPDC058052 TaxID=3346316 RepID=UPI0036EDF0EC
MALSVRLARSFDEAYAAYSKFDAGDEHLAQARPRLLAETIWLEPAFTILRDLGLDPHLLFVRTPHHPFPYAGAKLIDIRDPLAQGGDENRLYATLFGSAIPEADASGVLSYLAAEFTGHVPGMKALYNDDLMAGVGELGWREVQDRHTVHDQDLNIGCRESLTFQPPKKLFRAQPPPQTVRAIFSYRQRRPETVTYYETTWADHNDGLGAGAGGADNPRRSVRPGAPRQVFIADASTHRSHARVPAIGALHRSGR